MQRARGRGRDPRDFRYVYGAPAGGSCPGLTNRLIAPETRVTFSKVGAAPRASRCRARAPGEHRGDESATNGVFFYRRAPGGGREAAISRGTSSDGATALRHDAPISVARRAPARPAGARELWFPSGCEGARDRSSGTCPRSSPAVSALCNCLVPDESTRKRCAERKEIRLARGRSIWSELPLGKDFSVGNGSEKFGMLICQIDIIVLHGAGKLNIFRRGKRVLDVWPVRGHIYLRILLFSPYETLHRIDDSNIVDQSWWRNNIFSNTIEKHDYQHYLFHPR